ncbi:formate dehydrogenase accessory protein FdhE [Aquabacter sediminis]|uniref:formate dehydrogenase accessory protein FdhE n=1 Tax=Aquabacter sediminis TaxID=3029197 RepID=UPI00237DF016|nr:formate dehydrogenase accessory protein FdhE [Aquabacter sp. P-9]MDE1567299.1 formate dehydrogenase accessory protein FdhE [Aquabacter sp. P-9]
MSDFPSAVLPDPSVIGGVPQPPFARLPAPLSLFEIRARRLAALTEDSMLAAYLNFLAGIASAQHAIQHDEAAPLPTPEGPDAETLERARAYGMPPLDRTRFTQDPAFEATLDRLLAKLEGLDKPAPAAAALARVQAADPAGRDALVRNVLADSIPMEALAEHVYVAAALQVHFARLAARLDEAGLVEVGQGVCPTCGGPPAASVVVDWPQIAGARYCACSLCGTWWNHVRVRCVLCGSTKGIGLQEVEGGSGAVKAETCDSCHGYVKVMYQSKDPLVEPLADDVASLALDLLMKNGPYRRGAFNPFLLGY